MEFGHIWKYSRTVCPTRMLQVTLAIGMCHPAVEQCTDPSRTGIVRCTDCDGEKPFGR